MVVHELQYHIPSVKHLQNFDYDNIFLEGLHGRAFVVHVLLAGPSCQPDAEVADVLQGLKWEFVVINEPGNVNAMVMPGGKVVVYTGLLKLLRQEDEIAAVLGHEVAHVLARHIVSVIKTTLASLLAVHHAFNWMLDRVCGAAWRINGESCRL